MFVFFDESYNLKDRSKRQCISINGFAVVSVKSLFKEWKKCRRPFIGGRRIHASDPTFNKLRAKALQLIKRPDIILLTAFQVVQEIPFQKDKEYFYKGKLNFEKIYVDLTKALLKELHLEEYKSVIITIDSRKHKAGILGRNKFKEKIKKFLKQGYPRTKIDFIAQPSTANILLELADFVSNIFYRAYIKNDKKFFEDLKFKLFQIKNPL